MVANAYQQAGVDVEAGYEVVERIKKHVQKTHRKGVMNALGSFGGCFDLSAYQVQEPVLVSGTDGVGTKLLLAIEADRHQTIGIDCVAMCVNDILAQGAEPLYFLDYLATGKNHPAKLEQVVAGVAQGCMQAGAALIGGETAEMPDLYAEDEYDLAGFAVGLAEKSQLITGADVAIGDTLIGLPSSGIHSNGYSLVRKLFFKDHAFSFAETLTELANQPLIDVLLTPTKIYTNALLPLIQTRLLHGIAHITGGGFVENIPRMLPADCAAEIHVGTWPELAIFPVMQKLGNIPALEMYEIFNMGLGMVVSVAPEKVSAVQQLLAENGEPSFVIGQVVPRTTAPLTFVGGDK